MTISFARERTCTMKLVKCVVKRLVIGLINKSRLVESANTQHFKEVFWKT